MNKALKYFLFSFAFVVVGLLVGFKIKDNLSGNANIASGGSLMKLEKTLSFIQSNYVKSVDQEKLIDEAIQGIMESLDPHSFYIPAREMNQLQEQMEGSFDGIGIQFDIIEDTIFVVSPLAGGPSEEVGIMAGDRIVKVDGELVAGISINNSDVQRYLKGPRGTKVDIEIKRSGNGNLLPFTIKRDKIPLHSVNYAYMITGETGYIQVTRFAETTYSEFKLALDQLIESGMQNLILDLRGNPGGYMTMAYKMADEFLGEGKTIVSTQGRIPDSRQKYSATNALSSFEKGGLVILQDYGSASASEIVAGAIQDHDRGLILGVRSFGKGLVQIQEEFEDGSAIRIVISEYYTPSGRCIQKPYDKSSQEYEQEIMERFESGEIFDESKAEFPDSLKYRTNSGRTVYGGGGIFPDIFVPNDTTMGSEYFTRLVSANVFNSFAFQYVDQHSELERRYTSADEFVKNFKMGNSIIRDFVAFAESKGVEPDSRGLEKSRRLISYRLKAFIGRRLFKDDAYYPVLNQLDNVLQRALELIPEARQLEATGQLTR